MTVNTNYITRGSIKVVTDPTQQLQKFSLNEIDGYNLNNDYYALKELKHQHRTGTIALFMKKMNRTDSGIQLYRSTVKQMIYDKNKPAAPISYQYYIQLPNDKSNIVYSLKEIENSDHFYQQIHKAFKSKEFALKHPEGMAQPIPREKRTEILMQLVNQYTSSE
jgi:hypothetical protein